MEIIVKILDHQMQERIVTEILSAYDIHTGSIACNFARQVTKVTKERRKAEVHQKQTSGNVCTTHSPLAFLFLWQSEIKSALVQNQ